MKVLIKNVTGSEFNDWCLWELSKDAGIKEGDIIEDGIYNPKTKAFDFSRGGVDCVAWVGETCEILEEDGNTKNEKH